MRSREAKVLTRAFLKIGDKTTSGGVVVQGFSNATHFGTELTYIGASVYCPACESTGHIIPDGGHRLPMNWMGKQPALENDLCLCKCGTPPSILASQRSGVVSEDDRAQARKANTSNLSASPAASLNTFDERFRLVDGSTGAPLAGFAYRALSGGTLLASGVTDHDGRTKRISTPRGQTIHLQIKEGR
jgi:uncharacterized Zn-binding protein involved in type VI secretion